MSKFKGVVPPVVTPLKADLTVDYASYTRVLEHLIEAGCHGLFVLGSTSEVVFHDEKTRQEIIEHSAKVINGRVPLIVGVIDPTTDRVINHAEIAKAAGADAVVVTAPFYTVTSQSEILDHFRYIRDAVDVPLIAYDIPVCVHVKLQRQTTVTLAREGAIIGVKDSSGDDGNFRYLLLDLADRKDIFLMTGSEIVVDNALLMGAHGVVPGIANVDPHGYVRLWNAAQRGDWVAARKEQERLCRLFEIVWVAQGRVSGGASGIGAFKAAMKSLGIIDTALMPRPRAALNDAETGKINDILRATGLLA
ncbi:dihydrodipicolinate synthase family protein [Agrobacterium rhizogenes]|uniref:Dihydrodipicolinate synthase protein n=2 Tax=Rhizobium rhizogenes TaxID=359 RepID=B9JLK6_RHIR8|nr:dihydrodipicolinate synthase family protein [Rhizobium rhizogenes]ACM30742.1 dihydrodipicolinate synthase protein [Rhizobium rhizogenes K84]KAA6488921.1 dihydrodipicolinate synthase family protein [Agrobacterium sp. ICMP 7243]OCJ01475.1 dihydrodipicolinate synthase family protein [Agrobacterium sp. 13-626]OCJ16081.1 dihydrodipicolinate synthase family protein [Agrobacterium sp. B131/95]OCJ19187.1 dihydrodipicolinate synthase family protein [Agrobacterium sp. B133/95]